MATSELTAHRTFRADQFRVGQQVRQRTFSVPPHPLPQKAQLHKRVGTVVKVFGAGVCDEVIVQGLGERTGGRWQAFELVPADD